MAKTTKAEAVTETKPPFWTTLPGIFTGLGGVIVAITGLVTALYSTGAIGAKPAPTPEPMPNTIVSLVSTPAPPAPAAPVVTETDNRYKPLAGTWQVIEEQPGDVGGAILTWNYTVTVSGNKLTLTGKLIRYNGDAEMPATKKGMTSKTMLLINDLESSGIVASGMLYQRFQNGSGISNPASIVLAEDLTTFTGTLIVEGHKCILTGTKQ